MIPWSLETWQRSFVSSLAIGLFLFLICNNRTSVGQVDNFGDYEGDYGGYEDNFGDYEGGDYASCNPFQFLCYRDDHRCIESSRKCDSIDDCYGGEDEEGCDDFGLRDSGSDSPVQLVANLCSFLNAPNIFNFGMNGGSNISSPLIDYLETVLYCPNENTFQRKTEECPLGYKFDNPFCIKLIYGLESFEKSFIDKTDTEKNIIEIIQTSEQKKYEQIKAHIALNGYEEVWIPAQKMNEDGPFIYFGNLYGHKTSEDFFTSMQNSSISLHENFNISHKYLALNILTNTLKSYSKIERQIPFVRIIDTSKKYHILILKNDNKTGTCNKNWYFLEDDGVCIKLFVSTEPLYETVPKAKQHCLPKFYEVSLPSNYEKVLVFEVNFNVNSQRKVEDFSHRDLPRLGWNFKKNEEFVFCKFYPRPNVPTTIIELLQTNENLCINFNSNDFALEYSFPRCFCSWNSINEFIPHKSRIYGCHYEYKIPLSGYCQCSVLFRYSKQGLIHSEKFIFQNLDYKYFTLNIIDYKTSEIYNFISNSTNSNYILKNYLEKKMLLPENIMENIQFDYSETHIVHSKNMLENKIDILFLLALKTEIVEETIYELFNQSANSCLKLTSGCPYQFLVNNSLTWEKTNVSGYFEPKEICISQNYNPSYRRCLGDFSFGYNWDFFSGNCRTDVDEFTKELFNLLQSNDSEEILYKIYTKVVTNKFIVNPYTIQLMTRALKRTTAYPETLFNENISIKIVVFTIGSILGDIYLINNSSRENTMNLSTVNNIFNTSNEILDSLDSIIGKILLNKNLDMPHIVANNKMLFLYINELPKENQHFQNVLESQINYESQQYKMSTGNNLSVDSDVIIFIPKSLNYKEVVIIFKIWKSLILFQDDSLKIKNKNVVGNVIDISFKNKKTGRPITIKNDTINILFKLENQEIGYVTGKYNNYECVFWELKAKRWSQIGCYKGIHYNGYINCTCIHVTHFALLFHAKIDKKYQASLNIIVYICSGISVVSLLIVIASAFLLKHWAKKNDREGIVLVNLCASILGATMSMQVGIGQDIPTICAICRNIINYFLLSSFCWMLSDAVLNYLKYVKRRIYIQYKCIVIMFIFSWIFPIIYIGLLRLILGSGEADELNGCWIDYDSMIWGFLVPLIFSLSVNAVLLALISHAICMATVVNNVKVNLQTNESFTRRKMRQIISIFSLSIILGFTWIFGIFMMMGKSSFTIILAYIFSFFQSLQGFFIFFRIWQSKVFRKDWHRFTTELKGERYIENAERQNNPKKGINK